MRALGKSRRTVQRYLRQLERAGYISVQVIHARTRMCAGLFVALLAPLFPRHHRQKWPHKLIDPDAPRKSQNNRLRIKYSRESVGTAMHGRCFPVPYENDPASTLCHLTKIRSRTFQRLLGEGSLWDGLRQNSRHRA